MSKDSIGSRLKRVWNTFMNRDPTEYHNQDIGVFNYHRPDRLYLSRGMEKTIITSIYNRISLDVASIKVQHVRLDMDDRYLGQIDSPLNSCLTLQANIDQTSRAFFQDVVLSMFDEGCVAIVPIDTDRDPFKGTFDIYSLRTAKIVEWYPRHVKVEAYNDTTGEKEQIIVAKESTAIIENPFYSVMNSPNSTMQRLIKKLALLDVLDEKQNSSKLDLIIQLPYTISNDVKRKQANDRMKDIERQLKRSEYGIVYTDGTERITQLNRPVENNLLSQIEYLTNMVYSQLGINNSILDGSANEETMLNYYSRMIEPIVAAITDAMKVAFLTKTARTQHQSIEYFRDPFNLVPVSNIAEIADKFTRNEIMTSNEIRQIIGMKPSSDPNADKLRNKNLSEPGGGNQNDLMDQTTQLPLQVSPENGASEEDEKSDMTPQDYLDAIAQVNSLDDELDAFQKEIDEDIDDEDELKHYASPYYDPVKAHEYYERTKKLKGRRSTKDLNDEGKATASYVKEQINAERDKKIEESKQKKDKGVEAATTLATQNKTAASTKKKSAVEQRNAEQKAQIAKMREDYKTNTQYEAEKSKIRQLRDSLKGLSKAERAKRKEQVDAQIASITAAYKADKEQRKVTMTANISKLREDNAAYKAQLTSEYKQTVETENANKKTTTTKLREEHKTNTKQYRQEANDKYEAELDKIRSERKFRK